MPALNVDRFVTPEQKFEGLYHAADALERRNYRNDQLRLREEERQQQREAKRAASARFFANYLDPKDRFTGTNYDPETYKLLDNALSQAYDLASKGVNDTDILAAINPLVNKANTYTQAAKVYNEKKKQFLEGVKPYTGYKINELSNAIDKAAFFNEDGTMKNIDEVRPDDVLNYAGQAIQKGAADITTNAGIERMVKTYDKVPDVKVVKRTNARGGTEYRKTKITAPSFMTVDEQGELVPKYNIATDDGQVQMHEFTLPDGTKKTAPIRLLDESLFDNMMQKNPDVADWVKGQLSQAGMSSDFNSPQSKNAARALLYTEIKNLKPGGMEDVEEVKAAPIRVNNTFNMGGGLGNINDLYGRIDDVVKKYSDQGYHTRGNALKGDMLSAVRQAVGDNELDPAKFFLSYNNDGIGVYKTTESSSGGGGDEMVASDANLITTLPRIKTNLGVQANSKGKQEVISKGEKTSMKKSVPLNTLKSLIGTKGYEGYTIDELIDYYKSNGYEIKQ